MLFPLCFWRREKVQHVIRVGPCLAQDYFLGSGAVFGLLPALVGEVLPGSGPMVAEGNVLRRGPVIFLIPQHMVDRVKAAARDGAPACQQLQLDLFRCMDYLQPAAGWPLRVAISMHASRTGWFHCFSAAQPCETWNSLQSCCSL